MAAVDSLSVTFKERTTMGRDAARDSDRDHERRPDVMQTLAASFAAKASMSFAMNDPKFGVNTASQPNGQQNITGQQAQAREQLVQTMNQKPDAPGRTVDNNVAGATNHGNDAKNVQAAGAKVEAAGEKIQQFTERVADLTQKAGLQDDPKPKGNDAPQGPSLVRAGINLAGGIALTAAATAAAGPGAGAAVAAALTAQDAVKVATMGQGSFSSARTSEIKSASVDSKGKPMDPGYSRSDPTPVQMGATPVSSAFIAKLENGPGFGARDPGKPNPGLEEVTLTRDALQGIKKMPRLEDTPYMTAALGEVKQGTDAAKSYGVKLGKPEFDMAGALPPPPRNENALKASAPSLTA